MCSWFSYADSRKQRIHFAGAPASLVSQNDFWASAAAFSLPGRPFSVPPGIVPEPERTDGLLRQQHLENCGKRKSGVQWCSIGGCLSWRIILLRSWLVPTVTKCNPRFGPPIIRQMWCHELSPGITTRRLWVWEMSWARCDVRFGYIELIEPPKVVSTYWDTDFMWGFQYIMIKMCFAIIARDSQASPVPWAYLQILLFLRSVNLWLRPRIMGIRQLRIGSWPVAIYKVLWKKLIQVICRWRLSLPFQVCVWTHMVCHKHVRIDSIDVNALRNQRQSISVASTCDVFCSSHVDFGRIQAAAQLGIDWKSNYDQLCSSLDLQFGSATGSIHDYISNSVRCSAGHWPVA